MLNDKKHIIINLLFTLFGTNPLKVDTYLKILACFIYFIYETCEKNYLLILSQLKLLIQSTNLAKSNFVSTYDIFLEIASKKKHIYLKEIYLLSGIIYLKKDKLLLEDWELWKNLEIKSIEKQDLLI
jgi:hypothetical protein